MAKENIFGKNLRELREARGLQQKGVAEKLEVPSATYSSWERGRTEPDIDRIVELADYFKVSTDKLLRSRDYQHKVERHRIQQDLMEIKETILAMASRQAEITESQETKVVIEIRGGFEQLSKLSTFLTAEKTNQAT